METIVPLINKIAISGSDNSKFTVDDSENSVTYQIHFLLYESCFWCAFYLINKDKPTTVSKCPICRKMKVKSRPISDNYDYKSCWSNSCKINISRLMIMVNMKEKQVFVVEGKRYV
jgi:hypothetical protein